MFASSLASNCFWHPLVWQTICNGSFMEIIQLRQRGSTLSKHWQKRTWFICMVSENPQQNGSCAISSVCFSVFQPSFRTNATTKNIYIFRVHLPSYIKYGTFTPLESTDYSNFLILSKQKKQKTFFTFYCFTFDCWIYVSWMKAWRRFFTKYIIQPKHKKWNV